MSPLGGKNLYIPVILGVLSLCSLVFSFLFFVIKRAEGSLIPKESHSEKLK